MKLQKLVYLAQGWNLAITENPMFRGDFEAWVNGPVSRDLFRYHRRMFHISRMDAGDENELSGKDKIVLKGVIDNYGSLSGQQLGALTHVNGTPWDVARKRAGVEEGEASSVTIDEADMRTHFKKILGIRQAGDIR